MSGPTPGDLSNPGIEPRSPTLQVDSLLSEPPEKPMNTEAHSFSGDLPNPGIKPRSPTLQVDSLLSEPPGKPKATILQFNLKKEWGFTAVLSLLHSPTLTSIHDHWKNHSLD